VLPSNDNQSPKKMLLDLARELDGETIEDTFLWMGREWTIRLLTEEESNWRNSFINTGSRISTVSSWRLPTLSIGIRAINGIPVFEFFREEWESTEEGRQIVQLVDGRGRYNQKYFAAEYLMQYLAERPPERLEEMWGFWESLEQRREDAQDAAKKSSGEGSEEGEKPTGTESSPSGDE